MNLWKCGSNSSPLAATTSSNDHQRAPRNWTSSIVILISLFPSHTNQTDISVARIKPNGCGGGHEPWLFAPVSEVRLDSKFFATLPPGGRGRMLVGLDMPTRRKLQPRKHVVNKQDVTGVSIHHDDIRDQMSRRKCWLRSSEHVIGTLKPPQGVGQVFRL
jgi:hypothetical protein